MAAGEGSNSWQKRPLTNWGVLDLRSCWRPGFSRVAFDSYRDRWPQTALEPWSFVSSFRGWAVARKVEVSACPPAVCCLVPGSMGSAHGYRSGSPPALEGEASRLESWCSKHTLERLVCRFTIESQSTWIQSCWQQWEFSMSVLSIVYGNMSLYMLFFPIFKVKMSKVHKN